MRLSRTAGQLCKLIGRQPHDAAAEEVGDLEHVVVDLLMSRNVGREIPVQTVGRLLQRQSWLTSRKNSLGHAGDFSWCVLVSCHPRFGRLLR